MRSLMEVHLIYLSDILDCISYSRVVNLEENVELIRIKD